MSTPQLGNDLSREELVRLLDAVREMARASTEPDLGRATTALLVIACRATESDRTSVFRVDEEAQELLLVGVHPISDAPWQNYVRMSIEGTLTGAAVRSGRPAVWSVEAAGQRGEDARSLGIRQVCAVPLGTRGRPEAVLHFARRADRPYDGRELQFAQMLGELLIVYVENARLYAEVRTRGQELERTQEKLIERERLVALGQLAATLAHEVRNPLGVFFNAIGTLRKVLRNGAAANGEDVATLLDIMSEESSRLERLVRDLLDFARPRAPLLEPERIGPIVVAAAGAVRELSPDADIMVDIADELPRARVDASMIRRAIVNLVLNAVQATVPTGSVRVSAAVADHAGRSWMRVAVADTGPGISPELTHRVFEPFFTTKATGTGLGLSVVKGIAESHGGEVSLSSTVGRGTTVSLLLPIHADG